MRATPLFFLLLITQSVYAQNAPSRENQRRYLDLYPITVSSFFGYLAMLLLASLAVIGGLGGGVVAMSVLIIFFQTQADVGNAISNTFIAVSAIVQYWFFLRKQRHYSRNVPLVDYGITAILLPMSMIGNKCGLLIYRIFTGSCMLLLASVLALVMALLIIKRAVTQIKKIAEANELERISKERRIEEIRM